MLPVIIGIVVVVVIVCAIAGIYNNMVTKRNRIDNAWQNIDTQLQRRNDLIPNLVETVKGYAKHEQDTLAAVINARLIIGTVHDPIIEQIDRGAGGIHRLHGVVAKGNRLIGRRTRRAKHERARCQRDSQKPQDTLCGIGFLAKRL